MAAVEQKKKHKRFSLFRSFKFHKKNKEQNAEESEPHVKQGVQPIEITKPSHISQSIDCDINGNPPAPNSAEINDIQPAPSLNQENAFEGVLNDSNANNDLLRGAPSDPVSANSDLNSDHQMDDTSLSGVYDNSINEHIEEILLSEAVSEESISSDESQRASDSQDRQLQHESPTAKKPEVEESHVIPSGLSSDTLFVYIHILIAGLLCSFSAVLSLVYAAVVFLTMSRGSKDALSSTLTKMVSSVEDIGVSWHVVIWVLLASFWNIYIALLYAAIVLIYKLCLAVVEEIAQAIAQLVASLIFVLFLGPVIALFGAIFSSKSDARRLGMQGHIQGQGPNNNKASNVIEALLKFFLFPLYLPVMLQQYHRQQHRQPKAPSPQRPSRDCDVLRRLFRSGKTSRAHRNGR